MRAGVFNRYAAYYDLLYRDKDYEGEVEYVARRLRNVSPNIGTLLEFGSGTGRHGRLLASRGFEVTGIEKSRSMVEAAQATPASTDAGSFVCQEGDIGTFQLNRKYDAVIALFQIQLHWWGRVMMACEWSTATTSQTRAGALSSLIAPFARLHRRRPAIRADLNERRHANCVSPFVNRSACR